MKRKSFILLLALGMLTLAAQAQQTLADLIADCPDGGTLTLTTDLHEDKDVAAQYPDIVKQMKDIIKAEHTESNLFKVTLPK